MKQEIENIKKEFDEWYKNQKEMNPYIMRDWFLNKYSLIADEVLKVVVKKIEERINNFYIMKGGKIDRLPEPEHRMTNLLNENMEIGYSQACRDILDLLSNLSPNKENKNNEN